MKPSILVSVGTAIGLLAATVAQASTVTTEHGRPLLVETEVSGAACGDVTVSIGTEANNWQDALAGKLAHDRFVQASWHNALANKRVQDRAVILASAGSATECALTN